MSIIRLYEYIIDIELVVMCKVSTLESCLVSVKVLILNSELIEIYMTSILSLNLRKYMVNQIHYKSGAGP